MSASNTPDAKTGRCARCKATLPAGARFCAACGEAVDAPPGDAALSSTPAAPDLAGARASNPRREALITLLVVTAAVVIVAVVALSGRVPFLASPTVPPAGEIWFGDTYDSSTFVIATRWTSTVVGRPLAAVAHLTTPVSAGQATLHIALDGKGVADEPLNGLTGTGDLIGLTFTPPQAGAYTFTITSADGTTLASGTIAAS